jgi:DNA-binding LacI/PurR family transcriptional regulator
VGRVGSNLVAADHQRAMVMAVQKIHEYGYRRIGLVYNQAHDRSLGGNYYGGFRWAEQLAGIEQLIPPFDSETKTPQFANRSRRGLQGWMKRFQPDAILTSCPETPLFLRELGYRIPTDVAVASTSPYDISIDTGIDQRPHAIGQMAAEMLIKQISLNERGEPPNFCRILIESRWRDGTSLPPRR